LSLLSGLSFELAQGCPDSGRPLASPAADGLSRWWPPDGQGEGWKQPRI